MKKVALTKNQQAVYDCLLAGNKAMTAYELLDDLRDQGLRAPPQIYRALDKLRDMGLIHRLESLNAFVACCGGHARHQNVAFMICDACGQVQEIDSSSLRDQLGNIVEQDAFTLKRSVLELHGCCKNCH